MQYVATRNGTVTTNAKVMGKCYSKYRLRERSLLGHLLKLNLHATKRHANLLVYPKFEKT